MNIHKTALIWAAKKKCQKIVDILLNQPEIDVNCTDIEKIRVFLFNFFFHL